MRPAYHPSSIETRGTVRRRSAAFVLTVVAHILIILLLLRLAPAMQTSNVPNTATTFQMLPDQGAPAPTKSATAVAKANSAGRKTPKRSPAPPRPVPKLDAVVAPGKLTLPIELLGGDELFRAADVSKLPTHPEDQVAKVEKKTTPPQQTAKAIYGPGNGPSGGPVYDMADWYRLPSSAEMDGYLARPPSGSWGRIICRAQPEYRVDNCRTDGESPIGSGIARAMRRAAWQYRIIPPRKDGKMMIGIDIRITMTYTENGLR